MPDLARAIGFLVQPLAGKKIVFLDPTWPQPNRQYQDHSDSRIENTTTGEPSTSPYGDLDRWGMLWVGHCGCRFPWAADENVPLGRAIIPNDETVPPRNKISLEFGDAQLINEYPNYTRVVARSRVDICTVGYALSQSGRRRMLYEFGVQRISGTTDMMFRSLCDGVDGRDLMVCLSPQPALLNHHRPAGPRSTWSDISGSENPSAAEDQARNEVPFSVNIR